MQTKLTLTIEKSVVSQAKQFARIKNKSVSHLVEEYLENLSKSTVDFSELKKLDSPITESITGMFYDNGKTYSEMLTDALVEARVMPKY